MQLPLCMITHSLTRWVNILPRQNGRMVPSSTVHPLPSLGNTFRLTSKSSLHASKSGRQWYMLTFIRQANGGDYGILIEQWSNRASCGRFFLTQMPRKFGTIHNFLDLTQQYGVFYVLTGVLRPTYISSGAALSHMICGAGCYTSFELSLDLFGFLPSSTLSWVIACHNKCPTYKHGGIWFEAP